MFYALHRFASCKAPQELTDEQVERVLEDEVIMRHVASSKRPSLDRCTPDEFEADIIRFLEVKGEEQLAVMLREKRITW
jgi:hypothetical protein